MNINSFEKVENLLSFTVTDFSNEASEILKDSVKISSGYIYIYNSINTLWEKKNNRQLTNYIYNFFNKTLKEIKKQLSEEKIRKIKQNKNFDKTLEDNILKLVKNLDKCAFVDDVVKRSIGNFEDPDFIKNINSKSDYLAIRNNKKINLKTLEITDRQKDDFFTFLCDVEYKAKTKNADRFFKEIMPNKSEREYLRRCLGYMLSGDTSAQVFFVWYGSGSNGKSLLSLLLKLILNDYYVQCAKHVFQKSKSDSGASPHLVDLLGRRCGVYSEGKTADNMELDIENIKQISGQDPIKCRGLYKDYIQFTSSCKLNLVTNYVPPFDTQKAVKRRLRYIYFDTQFQENPNIEKGEIQIDSEFAENLKTKYLDEVFSWIVKGSLEYYKTKSIEMTKKTEDRTNKLLMNEDSIETFMKYKLQITDNKKDYISKKDLFNYYKKFCDDNSQRCQPRSTLFNRFEHIKITSVKLHGYDVYRKLRIIDDENYLFQDDDPLDSITMTEHEQEINKRDDKIKELVDEIEQLKNKLKESEQKETDDTDSDDEPEEKPKKSKSKSKTSSWSQKRNYEEINNIDDDLVVGFD